MCDCSRYPRRPYSRERISESLLNWKFKIVFDSGHESRRSYIEHWSKRPQNSRDTFSSLLIKHLPPVWIHEGIQVALYHRLASILSVWILQSSWKIDCVLEVSSTLRFSRCSSRKHIMACEKAIGTSSEVPDFCLPFRAAKFLTCQTFEFKTPQKELLWCASFPGRSSRWFFAAILVISFFRSSASTSASRVNMP